MKTKHAKPNVPLPQGVCVDRGRLEPECAGFAKLLRLLLKLTGWSLENLAGITHLDKGYLWELAKGTSCNPTLDVIARIAKAFRLKLEHFMRLLVRHASKAAVLMPDLEWSCWI
ncbi:helix-turn-helix transcriptional regulator [Prosthecobacter sp.]|uniref:helix-turn-helix domain-containing protein n=1 Tax=Prosthecobacter sp. TaxID=1965333 RepID=UPI002ABC9094|nr:helix-turn-helix transcriptional regulator [Prosthecobacter sp.]MDZ4401161.1 helix-turn-helix transcriptional regulator [Prosthecobacter sp.]